MTKTDFVKALGKLYDPLCSKLRHFYYNDSTPTEPTVDEDFVVFAYGQA